MDLDDAVDLSDKPFGDGEKVRELPSHLRVELRAADGITVPRAGRSGVYQDDVSMKEQIALLRGLKGERVTVTTRAISFTATLQSVRVLDEGLDNQIRVEVTIRAVQRRPSGDPAVRLSKIRAPDPGLTLTEQGAELKARMEAIDAEGRRTYLQLTGKEWDPFRLYAKAIGPEPLVKVRTGGLVGAIADFVPTLAPARDPIFNTVIRGAESFFGGVDQAVRGFFVVDPDDLAAGKSATAANRKGLIDFILGDEKEVVREGGS